MKSIRRSWIILLALSLVAVACAPPVAQREPGEGATRQTAPKRITAAIRGEPPALNYTINRAGAGGAAGTSEMDLLVNAGLVFQGGDKVLRPQLAEAVPSVDNGLWRLSPDGRMETTWRIKPSARWQDGTPFTAHDLVFTVQSALDGELGLVRYPAYDSIETAEAADAQTLVVRWRRPFIQADAAFSVDLLYPVPRHLLEPTYREDKSKWGSHPYWTGAYVGAGPYRLREWVPGSHALLDADDGYVFGRPKIDTIEVRFILDPNTLVANVLAGEVQLNLGRGISLEQALQARDQWREGHLDTSLQSWYALYPQFINPSPPVVADAQFRRALLHATDRRQLVDSFMGGLTAPADTVISPSEREYRDLQPYVVSYGYDPRAAAQLIEGLGYTRGADGSYRDAGGQRLTVEIRTGAGDELQEKLVLTIADYWQRAGVGGEAVIFPRQRSDDLEYRQTRPAFEMVRQPSEVHRYHSSGTPLPENNYRGQNRTRYRNAELDALIDRYFVTIPWQDRMQVLGQLVRHLSGELIAMGILYDAQPMLIANRLHNVSAAAQSANAHEWDLESAP